ncbi:sporulation integral membrane protein YlbJ [Salinibacillus xinjiangensis]|uniref:Sporulation integral membrane protein YlbJ n=1 Tax=Salinibacillus xinjiangensis TaxID=1229268 RepID=A0A6G1X3D8_9BACI|nr:sporulation integral membrane protein YlbJ [Salinibacillus xinjiangensis]MRG85513.1 sporulation integral membrane protein YlbJ [Salinibacillus xinjiangensis]
MNEKLKSILFASGALFLGFAIIQSPDQSLEASLRGLSLWWEIVFPSLLPFFITSELLIAFGVVRFFGVLCEPFMRPLFNVPGAGSFVWAMGMASGYPSGAKLTARLRQERQISKIEAERLVSFTNASNPLFIIAAISVGFFHDEQLGILLAVCHYLGNFFVGICMRFYGKREFHQPKKSRFSIKRAFYELHATRLRNNKPFGKILGDSVINSLQTLLMIGGFIIIFSVINKLLFIADITPFIANIFNFIFSIFGLPDSLSIPFIAGLFEITLGAQMTAQTTTPLLQQIIIVCFILGFNGLSVQAQVASILAETDIRFFPYFIGRLLHGAFASILAIILFKPLYSDIKPDKMGDVPVVDYVHPTSIWSEALVFFQQYGPMFTLFSLLIGVLIIMKRLSK